jgi:uncharacterized protein (DUF1501 family)
LQAGTIYGTASPEAPTGWLGRFLDGVEPGELPPAVDFNRAATLLLTGASYQPLSLNSLTNFGVYPSADADARMRAYARLQNLPTDSAVKQRHSRLRRDVLALSDILRTIGETYESAPGVDYDRFSGSWMRDCAALIAADRGLRCAAVPFPGYDTHEGQNVGPPNNLPAHQLLLTSLSQSIAALYADLESHGVAERVVILACSEFGRRAFDNVALGTDHGFGSLALVIGDTVKGGVYGDYPDLRDDYLVFGRNLDVHTDFRSVFGTILAQHFGADPEAIFDAAFPQLSFL